MDKMMVFDPRLNTNKENLKFRKFGPRTIGTPPFDPYYRGGFSVRLFAWVIWGTPYEKAFKAKWGSPNRGYPGEV